MRRLHAIVLFAGTLLLTGGCDIATKHVAEQRLASAESVPLISGVLELTHVRNPGVAFNLERVLPAAWRRPLIIGAGAMGILALIGLAWQFRRRSVALVAVALVLGGAMGNFGERIMRGFVTDFIYLKHWPVFNVADMAIVSGAILLVLATRGDPVRPVDAG